jgi:cysteine-rich repeat protein
VLTAGREQRVDVRPGRYTLLARAWGTDPVSMVMNTIIGTGCVTDAIADGETKSVTVELHPVVGEGLCGDRVVSPDEQCDDGATSPGDGCDAACRTEPFTVNTTTPMAQTLPDAAWLEGGRLAVAFDQTSPTRDIAVVMRGPDAELITSPGALAVEGLISGMGVQTEPAVGAGGGRVAVVLRTGFVGPDPMGDVQLQMFDADRNPRGMITALYSGSAGAQTEPDVATNGDGGSLVVWTDDTSATGLRGRFVPASGTPAGGDAFVVGTGATGASDASVAATAAGFTVVFTSGGDVFAQRFDATGGPVDAMAVRVVEGADATGTQDQPAAAALPDGRVLVAWRDSVIDGGGTGIRGRVLGADGAHAGMAFAINSSAGGDQAAPSCAAAAGRFACAWTSGGEVRARLLLGDGAPALNREPTPSTDDFVVATGAVTEPAAAANGGSAKWIVVWQEMGADPGDVRARVLPLP